MIRLSCSRASGQAEAVSRETIGLKTTGLEIIDVRSVPPGAPTWKSSYIVPGTPKGTVT